MNITLAPRRPKPEERRRRPHPAHRVTTGCAAAARSNAPLEGDTVKEIDGVRIALRR
jgi:hypothetical protein